MKLTKQERDTINNPNAKSLYNNKDIMQKISVYTCKILDAELSKNDSDGYAGLNRKILIEYAVKQVFDNSNNKVDEVKSNAS